MMIIGIILLSVGLLVSLLAFRGRVVARGQFCKKCRFDLAGLDLDTPPAKCPECGRDVHQACGRRVLLRRKSIVGIAVALIPMLGGFGTLGFWASGNASVILGAMPDRVVVGLTDLGMDAALDELVLRVSKVPNTMSASRKDHVIEAGLKHQANLSAAFDPRWGEVLAVLCINEKMTDDQLKRYFSKVIAVDMLFRDRVRQGASQIDCLASARLGRGKALNAGYLGYQINIVPIVDGVSGKQINLHENDGGITVFIDPMGGWTYSAMLPIKHTQEPLSKEIGTDVQPYIEYKLMLSVMSQEMCSNLNAPRHQLEGRRELGVFRVEHEIEIIDPDDSLVLLTSDSKLAQRTCKSIGVRSIRALTVIPDPEDQPNPTALKMGIMSTNLPANIAFRVFARLDDGTEIEIGQSVAQARGGTSLFGVGWSSKNRTPEEHNQLQTNINRMIAQGKVDVILKTDPSLAEYEPEIERVIGLTIVFNDVPVEGKDDISKSRSSSADTWIYGQCEDPDESKKPTDSKIP